MSTQERYINPFTDFGFKKLFGSDVNKDLLISFLNEVLPPKAQIKSLTYLKSENLGRSAIDRKVVYDLYCENEEGERFIVELQKAKQKFFKDRTIFYSTFPIQEQSQRGDWNFQLKAVYTVSILDFVWNEEDDESPVKETAMLVSLDTKKIFYDKLTYVYIQIPLFDKTEDELETLEDKWFYVMKNLQSFPNRPVALQERIFDKVFETAEITQFNKTERSRYEDSLKVYRDIKNSLDYAEERGETRGIDIGKRQNQIKNAKKALEEGLSIELVAKITELTLEEIQQIKNDLENK
ncbi:Rpn family recombination-promoting nuclease/putative transposase [Bernardetia sp.]|uniref:Rpn family recombination-promoting nuclease/putative transposase n=1 Tax=Bernardetia sp. TaxID=1937974 RepID=UPI0025BDC31B|nr:Rpn family recombination-promoting nuclease/putative transposase [Bernardetia sp.]